MSLGGPDIAITIHFHRLSDGDPTLLMRRAANRSMKITIAIHAVLPDCRNHEKSRPSDEDPVAAHDRPSDLQLVHRDASMRPPMICPSPDESCPSDYATWCKVSL